MMDKLKVFTAFSGYDSQCMALDRLGIDYELIGWSEIDKYAIQAHNAVYPQWADRNFGDISKIDWDKVPDFDLFTYSSPCFTGDTLVYTDQGYKEIKQVRIGDMVLTKEGIFKPCTAIGSDGYKHIFRLDASGILPIRCTKNHPFWVMSRKRYWDNSLRKWCYKFDTPCKKRFYELKTNDDFIGVPIIKEENESGYDDDSLWLLGRFIADGHMDKNGNTIFSIGNDKLNDFISHVKERISIYNHTQSCSRCEFRKHTKCNSLIRIADVGKGALNKKFSNFILTLTKRELRFVIDGYISGDGCFIKKLNMFSATTVSRSLALSLILAVQKAYGLGCSVYYDKRPNKHIIQGREVNQHDTYIVRWSINNGRKHYIISDDMIWYPIRVLEDTGIEEVIYNITVDESHTYTANNCSVGNCQDFSNAGLQKGGEEGSGTRSSLLWECRKAILAKRPKYLLLENVKALTSKKFMPLFQKWQDELASYGYSNYWKVLNAKNYGIPQNRERVYLVSILGNQPYYFPKPFKLEKKLKDVLESNVDEKYYLTRNISDLTRNISDLNYDDRSFKAIGYTRDKKGKVIKRHAQNIFNTIHTSTGSGNNTDCFIAEPKKIIPYDDYNGNIPKDTDIIGTVVPQFSRNAQRNGYKINEINSKNDLKCIKEQNKQ